jgi:hypothetical protein
VACHACLFSIGKCFVAVMVFRYDSGRGKTDEKFVAWVSFVRGYAGSG